MKLVFFLFLQWGKTSPLGLRVQVGPLIVPAPDGERIEQWWNDNWQGKSKVLGEKPASIPLIALH
jgi:hypothetical protein